MNDPLLRPMLPFRRLRLAQAALAGARASLSAEYPPVRDDVPATKLRVGAAMLDLFGLPDDFLPANSDLLPPIGCAIFTVTAATVSSSGGIVALRSGEVLTDTLDHTDPKTDGYDITADGRVWLPKSSRMLPGHYLSLLMGGHENHFHWLLMNFGRLTLFSPAQLAAFDGILIPAGLLPAQLEALRLAGLDRLEYIAVQRGETLSVGKLSFGWNLVSTAGINPNLVTFLRGLIPPAPGAARRRLYLDRRGAAQRRLVNETEIVAALARLDVEPVALENLSLAEQAALLQSASLVVAPHGAALTNIVFCQPGTPIVEIMPSARVSWCFRHLAAASGHPYDCVLGRSLPQGAFEPWVASPTHVAASVAGF